MSYPRPLATPLPHFAARTHGNPRFAFGTAAGRFVLLLFLPAEPAAARVVAEHLLANEGLFDVPNCVAFVVTRDPELFAALTERPAIRWMLDEAGEVSRLYGALSAEGAENPFWLLADPTLRALSTGGCGDLAGLTARLTQLPAPEAHAGVELHAPVLVVPRIFEPAFCRELIARYEAEGGTPSGVMRQVDGLTTGVMDDSFKRRRDLLITDDNLLGGIRARLVTRLLPEIHRAFQFRVTHIERYIVAAYDAEEGGHFRAHRDNDSPGTAHRRFACTINLNADGYDGGDLRFPEYGRRVYRPPTGAAVIFSCGLLHEVTPVRRGRRYAVLPFFYDEAAARIREKNAHLVAASAQRDAREA